VKRSGWIAVLASLLTVAALAAPKSPAKAAKMSSEDCLGCHSDPSLTIEEHGRTVSLGVDEAKFKASIHGVLTCTDCHVDVTAAPHDPKPTMPKCATCHADQVTRYEHGIHANAAAAGNTNVAKCQDCHGNVHEILPASDPKSKVAHGNIPATCGACHGKEMVMATSGMSSAPFNSYEQSVHGKAVNGGSEKAAVCTDCHGAHDILPGTDPQSPIAKFNVPNNCGKCHANVEAIYKESVHGEALSRGNWQSPACTDCHGIHTIKSPSDAGSSVAAANIGNTCAQCHASVRLTSEFGVPGNRVSSYLASYHGMASKVGSTTVANCASCHGVHNILPSSDPNSTINPANLAKTCGKCHPGANQEFVRFNVHVGGAQRADLGSKVIAFVTKFYIWTIVVVIGGMVVHNLIIFRKKLIQQRLSHPRPVKRMNLSQRIQHLTLLTTFITLVLTGFALKYPGGWLAIMFVNEHVRSLIHRIAGVTMIAVSLYHVWYLARTPDGRQMLIDMLPDWKDATDARDAMLYYLGKSTQRPLFRRFSYAEKAEYWALVWGTIVMAMTGFMAWFKVLIGAHLPGWWIDVALTIHWYEAVLATLAIIVWHLYGVIFDPDTYPMNWAWYDGKMSIEHYEHEHPLDSRALAEIAGEASGEDAGQKDEQPVEK